MRHGERGRSQRTRGRLQDALLVRGCFLAVRRAHARRMHICAFEHARIVLEGRVAQQSGGRSHLAMLGETTGGSSDNRDAYIMIHAESIESSNCIGKM
jgi:hypothetical protein